MEFSELSLPLLPCEDTGRWLPVKKWALNRHEVVSFLILYFSASRSVRNKRLSYPVYDSFVVAPEHIMTNFDPKPPQQSSQEVKSQPLHQLVQNVRTWRRQWHPTPILTWKIPWREEPGGLQSMGSLRVGHDFTFTFHFYALEKQMAPHSSVLAWKIPGTGEPGGLPSMGSQSRTRLKRLSSISSISPLLLYLLKWRLWNICKYGINIFTVSVISPFYSTLILGMLYKCENILFYN